MAMSKSTNAAAKSAFCVSAPGKVILHGEHAVVYGKTALASSLNLRTFLKLEQSIDGACASFNLLDIGLERNWSTEDLARTFSDHLRQRSPLDVGPPASVLFGKMKEFASISEDGSTRDLAVLAVLYLYLSIFGSGSPSSLPFVAVRVSSELPTGAGLGSSAAFAVCLSAAFLLQAGVIASPYENGSGLPSWSKDDLDLVNRWAFEAERIIHGNPSGIDNAISTYGGALQYQGKIIQPLSKVPLLRILLINTKVPRSTKTLVAAVRSRYEKFPAVVGPVLDSIEGISQTCQTLFDKFAIAQLSEKEAGAAEAINQSDLPQLSGDRVAPIGGGTGLAKDQSSALYSELEELIDMNQKLLEIIGVSHPALEHICSLTSKHGLHCKLTGAGGGGCALTLLRPNTESDTVMCVREEVAAAGYDMWETSIGGVGVAVHSDLEQAKNAGFNMPEILYA